PQLVRTFCHELTVYAVACGNGFPADGSADLFTPENTGVNATMFDRYLPFSCPLNTFVTDAVRFSPFHHH
ncbi:hypothetical protein UZ470_26310, partial [Escherichia coli]|nr:hypothetical protein [Escherichia coli]